MEKNLDTNQATRTEKEAWITKKRAVVLLASVVLGGYITYSELYKNPNQPEDQSPNSDTNATLINLGDSSLSNNQELESDNCNQEVCINNYDEMTPTLPEDRREALNDTLYRMVKRNLKSDVFSINDATIREGSVTGGYDLLESIHHGSFIVDIKSVDQSYYMTYRWSKDKNNSHLGGYSATAECLPDDKLKYGKFNCEDDFSKSKNNLERDPIIKSLPHSSYNYVISANTDKKGEVVLNVDLTLFSADTRDGGRDESIANYKKEIRDWIKSIGLNPDDYPTNYNISE